MGFETKDNTGSLFRNDKREKDTQPNATGRALIDGKEWFVSAYTNTTKAGDKYQKLLFKPVEAKREQDNGDPF